VAIASRLSFKFNFFLDIRTLYHYIYSYDVRIVAFIEVLCTKKLY
jgi:hypothetical protein